MLPPKCSPKVLLLNTPIPEGLSKAAPSPPTQQVSSTSISGSFKAAAAPEGQPPAQHVHNSHSKASEPVTVGASPTFQQAHSNHMQTFQPAGLRANPAKQHACSNHSPTTAKGHTQPTQGIHREQLALVTRGLRHRAPRDNIYIRLLFKDWEIYLICLIHRNKHKELSKMRRQKQYLPNKRNKTKVSGKELSKMEI